jgi:hypothetical protein
MNAAKLKKLYAVLLESIAPLVMRQLGPDLRAALVDSSKHADEFLRDPA